MGLGVRSRHIVQPRDDLPGRINDPVAFLAPGTRNLGQHLTKPRPAPLVLRRKVGAAVERL
jgi:hypothetical protein